MINKILNYIRKRVFILYLVGEIDYNQYTVVKNALKSINKHPIKGISVLFKLIWGYITHIRLYYEIMEFYRMQKKLIISIRKRKLKNV